MSTKASAQSVIRSFQSDIAAIREAPLPRSAMADSSRPDRVSGCFRPGSCLREDRPGRAKHAGPDRSRDVRPGLSGAGPIDHQKHQRPGRHARQKGRGDRDSGLDLRDRGRDPASDSRSRASTRKSRATRRNSRARRRFSRATTIPTSAITISCRKSCSSIATRNTRPRSTVSTNRSSRPRRPSPRPGTTSRVTTRGPPSPRKVEGMRSKLHRFGRRLAAE